MPSSAPKVVVDDSIDNSSNKDKTDHTTSELSEQSAPRRRLTFISHAGENKLFVRKLLVAIEQQAKIAAFFDDDMPVGTFAEHEMIMRAEGADQGLVVISRPFLTKEWPMKELNLFLEQGVKIFPLYHDLSPEELSGIIATYDRKAGDDEPSFREEMSTSPAAWRTLMGEIANSSRFEESSSLPDPCTWRDDVSKLVSLTGLQRKDFENESEYLEACASMVSPPRLSDLVPRLPEHSYVKSSFIDDVIFTVLDRAPNSEPHRLVLTGVGGAGKTVAASAVARNDRVWRYFKDGVLWMHDELGGFSEQRFVLSLNKVAEQFYHLVLSRHYRQEHPFHHDKTSFQAVRDAQEYFLKWQKEFDLRCLLVVDNAWNMEVLESVGTMGFDILVTTRQKDIVPMSPGWTILEVPPMNESDSLFVLRSCSGADEAMPKAALRVAEDCAFLPYALAIAGSTLRLEGDASSKHSWRTLHENLEDKANMQINKRCKQNPLNAVLAVSFSEMGRRQRRHFLKLAVFPYDVIAPKEMLRNLWEEEDLADAKFIARDLVDRCLMQVRGDGYTVHDLVLDFAKFKIAVFESIRESAISRQAQYLGRLDVTRDYAEEGKVGTGYCWLIAFWRSLEELNGDIGLEEKTYENSLRSLERSEATSDLALGYFAVARLFEIQGKFAQAGPLYARATEIMEGVLGPEDLDVATMFTNQALGFVMQAQHSRAIPLLEKALAIRKTKLGDDDKETMKTKRSLRDARAAQVGLQG